MDGIHDMGGMHGFGPIPIEEQETPFPQSWQGRVFASNLVLAVALGRSVDRFRFLIESMPPAQYLTVSYYERWLFSMLASIEESGILDEEDLTAIAAGEIPESVDSGFDALPPEITRVLVNTPSGRRRDMSGPAVFKQGDEVRARTQHPAGHSRLPRYARGRCGKVLSDNGNQLLPDSSAHGGEPLMQRLYTVSFSARELWGDQANAMDTVCLDLWESYLDGV